MALVRDRDLAHDGPRSFRDVVTYPESDSQAREFQYYAQHSPGRSSGQGSPGRVQHDSLILKSPLDQLSRSLSFKKDRSQAGGTDRGRVRDAKGKNRAAPDNDSNEPLSQSAQRLDAVRPPPLLKASDSSGTSFLKLDDQSPTYGTYSTETAPVNFGDRDAVRSRGNTATHDRNDADSDSESQLINAFRNSYSTHLTREGGARDSSYSWMTTDPESPNTTLDFRQAQAVFEAAHHRGEGPLARPDSSSDLHKHSSAQPERATSVSSAEWEGQERSRARASSWDSQAAAGLGLDRMPSQRSARSGKTRARKGKGSDADGQPRESGVSIFDPFHYASYESAPNSEEHTYVEELESPPASAVPSSYYPSGIMPTATEDDGLRPTSVYAYPLTPPMEQDPQFADAPTPLTEGGTGIPKPHHLSGRAKSLVPAGKGYRPYHSRFAHPTANESSTVPGGLPQSSDGTFADHAPPPVSVQGENRSYYSALEAAPDFPPRATDDPRVLQQQQLGAAFQHQQRHDTARSALAPRSASSPMPSYQPNQPVQQPRNVSAQASSAAGGDAWQPGTAHRNLQIPMDASGSSFSPSGFAMSRSTSEQSKSAGQRDGLKRSPSRVLASAMAKHRAQREAAGLTTDGEYYVDPKSGKHYFVPNATSKGTGPAFKGRTLASGRGGASEDKENASISDSGKKGRRKLAKKDAKWQLSQVKPADAKPVAPQHQQSQSQQHVRTPSRSAFSVHSASDIEEGSSGLFKGRKWKPWAKASNHSASSREGTPTHSPLQHNAQGRDGTNARRSYEDDSQEWLHEQGPQTPSAAATRVRGLTPSPGSSAGAYGGLMAASTASPASLAIHTPNHHDQYASERGQPGIMLSAAPHHSRSGSPQRQPHTRNGSVYSNYSYYGLPPSNDGHTPSPARSPTASPVTAQSESWADTSALTPTLSRTGGSLPIASPYLAPNGAEFQPGYIGAGSEQQAQHQGSHSRQPSTTLDKAKAGIKRSGSLQLLAPAKQSNLTVPKASHGPGGKKDDAIDLSQLDPNDPLACLHLGIDAHERGQLAQSADFFAKSANGGCGLGMLMYGLTLRHGWGCESDPDNGFRFLQKAAESVVQDLDKVISGQVQLTEKEFEEQGAKSELVLSIYELGQCFLRGWGVPKDKKAALQYFELAANLGDPDAQSELGFCYSTGRACKKDLKKAAKYYRLAAKQGQTSFGMQWIWKSKYDE